MRHVTDDASCCLSYASPTAGMSSCHLTSSDFAAGGSYARLSATVRLHHDSCCVQQSFGCIQDALQQLAQRSAASASPGWDSLHELDWLHCFCPVCCFRFSGHKSARWSALCHAAQYAGP